MGPVTEALFGGGEYSQGAPMTPPPLSENPRSHVNFAYFKTVSAQWRYYLQHIFPDGQYLDFFAFPGSPRFISLFAADWSLVAGF